jgi:murein DD-endopeptidase MepM/ murein hydrolase activator NlpD
MDARRWARRGITTAALSILMAAVAAGTASAEGIAAVSSPEPAAAQPGAALRTVPKPSGRAVELVPPRVRPGDAFLVRVLGTGGGESIASLQGTAGGRPLSFFRVAGGAAAFGALPLETPAGALAVEVVAREERTRRELEVIAPAFPHRELQVDRRFVTPPAPEVQARIEEDRAAFARAFGQPAAPPLFSSRFVVPRKARVTAGYGEERTFNAVRPSQHYGMDLAGKQGAPVVAANTGEVVLVRDCWASGRSVILWHGGGVYTTYFHLSKILVKQGARVARGQRIGQVGRTGRASGPHLHWGVRIGDLYVDPASVLRLPAIASR